MIETPLTSGFHMPAEWEEHTGVWLAWPHDEITFPAGRLKKAEAAYVEIIKHIHATEDVELLIINEQMRTRVTELLQSSNIDIKKITFHITNYADVWIRDYGPTFIKNPETRELAWVKWGYNAYGNKFPDLLKDNEVFFALRRYLDRRMFEPVMIMEGGAIETNGQGVILTTEQCLLNPNRNTQLNKETTEKLLKNYLGARKILWLKNGLVNDHTDGHIDELARFVGPNKIVCAYEENATDENYSILEDNYQTLIKAKNLDNNPFEIIKLPMPHMVYDDDSKAPASYTNFYIGNEVVLAATFQDENDAKALEILQSCFPDRKIIGIDCSDLICGGGGVHCITQQQPLI
jgi:agmatine deiminase